MDIDIEMPITSKFAVLSGSVLGRRHMQNCMNNQDAIFVAENYSGLVAVVCDGCSSAPSAEVGAKFQADILGNALLSGLAARTDNMGLPRGHGEIMRLAELALRQTFGTLLQILPGDSNSIISTYLLATAMVVIMDDEETTIWHRGDGVWQVNGPGPLNVIDQNDVPEYPAYGLRPFENPDDHEFKRLGDFVYKTADIQSVLIGTDGMTAFEQNAEAELNSGPMGGIDQFYEPVYLERIQEPLAQRRLFACGPDMGWRFSRLFDDTSFVLVRRKPA